MALESRADVSCFSFSWLAFRKEMLVGITGGVIVLDVFFEPTVFVVYLPLPWTQWLMCGSISDSRVSNLSLHQ